MLKFKYKAKNSSAETIFGEIQANSQDEAIELISRQGLMPVSVEERARAVSSHHFFSARGVRRQEVYIFTRQLANLIKSGVSILRSLHILSQEQQNFYFRKVIERIQTGIKNGHTFSECLAEFPDIFSSFYIAMVQVGEEGGNLKEMLSRLSEYQKNQGEINSKVRAAMAYPIFMMILGTGTVIFLLTFVMPKITKLFSNLDEQLPLMTKMMIGLSEFIRNGWMVIALIVFVLVLSLKRWSVTKSGAEHLSRLKLSLPIFGQLVLQVELARLARTLELLLKSGVSLMKGLQITVPILANDLIKKELIKCRTSLESGTTMGDSLKSSKYFPAMVTNMVTIGEETGSLESTLHDIADIYEQESNEAIKTFTTLLEPLLILAVGLAVGFIVIAMLLPIFQIDMAIR